MDWDDLRYVLAVAREGSALRAAASLGVNQTTVMRRMDSAERALGACLFERRRTGPVLTPAGRRAAEAAERLEAEVAQLASALASEQRALAGSIRFTTSDTLANRLLSPCLGRFQALHPGIGIELITGDAPLDIARGEADVALRGGIRPEGAGIVARRLPDSDWTIYCSRAYAEANGVPADRADIANHPILGMDGRLASLPGWLWLQASAPDQPVRFRSNSLVNLLANIKAGLGLGALPAMIGDSEPDLVRCFDPPPELRAELWLIVREELKTQPHVRAFADFLADYVRKTLG